MIEFHSFIRFFFAQPSDGHHWRTSMAMASVANFWKVEEIDEKKHQIENVQHVNMQQNFIQHEFIPLYFAVFMDGWVDVWEGLFAKYFMKHAVRLANVNCVRANVSEHVLHIELFPSSGLWFYFSPPVWGLNLILIPPHPHKQKAQSYRKTSTYINNDPYTSTHYIKTNGVIRPSK